MADTDSSSDSKVSSAQLRKIKKPIIEKRRRERINESLNQVKTLVLDALNKDESRFSKMEKADILEMTVQHLRAVQRREQRAPGGVGGPGGPVSAASRYRAGFTECAHEVRRYLAAAEGVSATVHERLVSHLEAIARRNNVLNGAVTEGLEAEGVKIEPVPSPVTTNHVSRSSSSNPSSVSTVTMNSGVLSLSSPSSVSSTVSMDSGVMNVNTATGNIATVATRAALPLNACVAVSANSSPATMTTTAMTQLPIRVATAGNVGGVLGQSSPAQYTTLTINGTTARILLAPGPVTFIAPPQAQPQAQPQALPQASVGLHPAPAQANVASDLRPGTAIPLYIHTHHLPSQHLPSPGASDGESGGSVSPVSMSSSTSNTSNASSSQHWPHAEQHPTEPHSIEQHAADHSIEQSMEQSQRPFPIKIQPESVYDPVWRPW